MSGQIVPASRTGPYCRLQVGHVPLAEMEAACIDAGRSCSGGDEWNQEQSP